MIIDKPELQKKAAVLMEALPFIKKYAGEIFVIKFGGNAMVDDQLAKQFAHDVVLMKHIGINPVIVHGGGPQIDVMLKRLKIESQFIDGLRVTTKETVEIAEMVLSGTINKSIVAAINDAGGDAIGLSGKDSHLVIAKKLNHNNTSIDLGFVGEPAIVNPKVLLQSINSNIIPVIAPIAIDEQGDTYNINADTMAGAIAASLGARRFLLLTDVSGVMDGSGNLLTDLNGEDIDKLIKDGVINSGMLPKVATCLAATKAGVKAAVIIDGRVEHAILLELFTETGVGTLIRSEML
jgi:acetylglutamate kinase